MIRKRKLNILFTCGGRRVSLLENFRDAMSRFGVSGKLFVTDVTDLTPVFHRADRGILVPPVAHPDYVPRLLEIVRENHVGLLVPLTDLDLQILARHRGAFETADCAVMIGTEQTVRRCQDKTRLGLLLEECGLQDVPTFTLEEFSEAPFYPCFVKPIEGSGGIGARRIGDAKELQAHLEAFGPKAIVQQFIPGEEFTVDVYRSRDGQVRCIVPRQRLTVRSGEVETGVTRKDPAIMEAAHRLGDRLEGLWGVFCAQCRCTREGAIYFFEINPRFGGGAPLAIRAGADLPLYLLQDLFGEPVTARIGHFTEDLAMMRYDSAVYQSLSGLEPLPDWQPPSFR